MAVRHVADKRSWGRERNFRENERKFKILGRRSPKCWGKHVQKREEKVNLKMGDLRLLLALALKPPHSGGGGGWRGRGEYSILLKD